MKKAVYLSLTLSLMLGVTQLKAQDPSADRWSDLTPDIIASSATGFNGNVGIGTPAPAAKLHVTEGGLLCDGTIGSTPVSGGGTRFMWVPDRSAFRAGGVTNMEWDSINLGGWSSAFGHNTEASGDFSNASGQGANASGHWSFATNYYTTASGDYSFASGNTTEASGAASTAMGAGSRATGINSTALGHFSLATGDYSFSVGRNVAASGLNSVTIGAGVGFGQDLINTNANSMAVGFNSDRATLYVGPSSGAGTIGKIGIGTNNPQNDVHIIGNIRLEAPSGSTDIQGGNSTQRVNLFSNTNAVNSRAWDEWYGSTGQRNIAGSFIHFLYNSTTSSMGSIGMTLAQNGYLGIGTTTPAYRLDVTGPARIGMTVYPSDRRYKKDIRTVNDAMNTIHRLRGTSYFYDTEQWADMHFPERKTYGFIAQELKEVLPELVFEDDEGYLAVNYQGVLPVLVEALKELDAKVQANNELENRLNNLEEELRMLKNLLSSGNGSPVGSKDQAAQSRMGFQGSLAQNVPNPFNHTTTIAYEIKQDGVVRLAVFSPEGQQIEELLNTQQTAGHYKVEWVAGDQLPSGIYTYVLQLDGTTLFRKAMYVKR